MNSLKKVITSFALMLITAFVIAGCSNTEERTKTATNKVLEASTQKGNKLTLSVPDSKIEWTGKKVTGQHNGTVDISGGELFSDYGKLTGGSFEINFTTIKNLDLEDADMNAKLVGHLKSDDFFSADKFPIGKFVITTVTPVADANGNNYSIGGNLTIKGITNSISFPAKVNITGDAISATADLKIDRTKWDVKFNSGTFFENLGDKMINDEIELKINIEAK